MNSRKNRFISFLFIIFILSLANLSADNNISGFWKSLDEETGLPAAVIGIYEYEGKMFGRLIITYEKGKPRDTIYSRNERAEALNGDPFYAGLDIIWDLEPDADKWAKGRIIDPQEGKIYHTEIWKENGNLIVRGKIKLGFFYLGRNQVWPPVEPADLPPGFNLPEMEEFIPVKYMPD